MPGVCNFFLKETQTQMFFSQFFEFFKCVKCVKYVKCTFYESISQERFYPFMFFTTDLNKFNSLALGIHEKVMHTLAFNGYRPKMVRQQMLQGF